MTLNHPRITIKPTSSPPAIAELTMSEVIKEDVDADWALVGVLLSA